MNRVVIGLGSNIDPQSHMLEARRRIGERFHVLATSRIVPTRPVGYSDQADFLNSVMLIETDWEKDVLHDWLRIVETDLGRVRTSNKNGPRTMDLDILVWNGLIVDNDVYERDFLKDGIREVMPEIEL